MSNYSQLTDFSAKDLLSSGTPEKKVRGSELDAEFSAIQGAIATKYDANNVGVLFASATFANAVRAALGIYVGGTVVFVADTVTATGSVPTGYQSAYFSGGAAEGSLISGMLAGSTDLAIYSIGEVGGEVHIKLRVLTSQLRDGAQTAYWTSVNISGTGVTLEYDASDLVFSTSTDGAYTILHWINQDGNQDEFQADEEYSAVFV